MEPQKLDIGSVFERIFAMYRDQFGLLIPTALVIFLPVAIVNGLLLADDAGTLERALSTLIATVATYWYQGTVVEAARDILDGKRDHTVGSVLSASAPFIVTLILAGFLAGIGILLGLVVFIVPGLFLFTRWAVIAPVIVLERKGPIEALKRSWHLVKGNSWQVFGVLALLFIATVVLSAVVTGILVAISDSFVSIAVGDLIVRVLLTPLSALAAAVIYFGLRAANDGVPAATGTPVASGGPESIPSGPQAPTG